MPKINLKVLQAHNFYRSSAPSGEDQVVRAELDMMRESGVHAETFYKYNDDLVSLGFVGNLRVALNTPWNRDSVHELQSIVNSFSPDVVHVHNTFPQLSPAVFRSVGSKAARVLTLHNYRYVCANAIPMRKGAVCTLCIDRKSTLPGVWFGCYRDSRVATIPISTAIMVHRRLKTWEKYVDAYIVFSEFQRNTMINAGFPAELIHEKPNFYSGPLVSSAWSGRDDKVVFVGRLSHEKGVDLLIDAWRILGDAAPELLIIGDGDLRETLQARAKGMRISFLGRLSSADTINRISLSKLLVLPSRCFEGFPMVIQEAFAVATPVLVSNIGPLPYFIDDGLAGGVFSQGSAQSLKDEIVKLLRKDSLLQKMSAYVYSKYLNTYTKEKNIKKLFEIYAAAISKRHESRGNGRHA